jgi:ketosteroid isomerase-like protein
MSGNLPVETVLAFLEQINARNVDGLCALVTEDHLFVDGLGNRMQGRESMRKGWAGYFRMFPDYRVSHTDVFSQADVVAAFGSAEGTLAVKGELPKGNHWERAGGVASGGARWLDRGMAGLCRQSEREKNYGCAKSIGRFRRQIRIHERTRHSRIA